MDHALPDHAPRFVRCQSIRQRPPDMGTQKSVFRGVPPCLLIEHSCPFVETSRVPRVREAKLSEVEMMAELMAQVLRNAPNEVTSFRTAVFIHPRISMESGEWSPKSSNVPRSRVRRGLTASTRTPQVVTHRNLRRWPETRCRRSGHLEFCLISSQIQGAR